ncbi:MAG: LysM peptidoglycan-binding domain-containing protein [Anaerolineae bacterium]|nr:LysM peptidoglycan-binding domain-containing protein [Anaerolineae bacterium]
MVTKRLFSGILLAVLILGSTSSLSIAEPALPATAQQGTNLVSNPGFEGLSCAPGSAPGWCEGNWTHNAFDGSTHGNIFTPQGWVSWWRTGGDYGQPEIKTIPRVPPFTGEIERIRSGNYGVLLFTFYRLQDTGLFQVVTGLTPGTTVQFSAYAHGWSCNSDSPMGHSCGDPWNQRFQVGIEPNGIANPFASSIVWSPEQLSPDTYRLIGPVTAQVGSGGKVTVLLRSKTKWEFKYGDAYWDDTSLVVVGSGPAPTATPVPQPTATAVPQPTATPVAGATPVPTSPPAPAPTVPPSPSEGTLYTVVSGDTLYGISRRYGVTLQAIVTANGIVNPNLIRVGQQLTIPGGAAPPAPAPPPSGGTVHTVQAGETLTRISLRYGVSVWTIVGANNIVNPNLIFPGQQLTIPG